MNLFSAILLQEIIDKDFFSLIKNYIIPNKIIPYLNIHVYKKFPMKKSLETSLLR